MTWGGLWLVLTFFMIPFAITGWAAKKYSYEAIQYWIDRGYSYSDEQIAKTQTNESMAGFYEWMLWVLYSWVTVIAFAEKAIGLDVIGRGWQLLQDSMRNQVAIADLPADASMALMIVCMMAAAFIVAFIRWLSHGAYENRKLNLMRSANVRRLA